jgi:hypothetical protein
MRNTDQNSKRRDYTHVLLLKELHTVLTREEGRAGISISDYIAKVIARNQAIEALMAAESTVTYHR